MKKNSKYVLIIIVVVGVLILGAVGRSLMRKASNKVAEKAAETAINSQLGGKADVNLDKDNIKVNTKEGSYEAGNNVKLPDGFPSDVYVIDGNIKSAITGTANDGFTISIETGKTIEEVSATYQEKFKSNGWNITGTMSFGDSSSIVAEKEGRTASVTIGKSDDKVIVILSTGKK